MKDYITQLSKNKENFVKKHPAKDPKFSINSSKGQESKVLWIGCADSCVSPNEIKKPERDEIFVHRNIADLVIQTDMNMRSVLQYAVEVLNVEHVIVSEHYGCGGAKAAIGKEQYNLIDNWLWELKDTQNFYWKQLEVLNEAERFSRLVELSVIEQVNNLGKTNSVQTTWGQRKSPWLHAWVHNTGAGYVKEQAS